MIEADSDNDSDNDAERTSSNRNRRSSYAQKQRKDYERILEKKERKRLLGLKREITMKPKRPKMLTLDVIQFSISVFLFIIN